VSYLVGDLPDNVRKRIAVQWNGCWRWTGLISNSGYGRLGRHYAHRYVYELCGELIPEGFKLDHLCRNTYCVNPAHLEPVTHRENTLRGISAAAENAVKTHCKRGHELSGHNLLLDNRGHRQCRECCNARKRLYRMVGKRNVFVSCAGCGAPYDDKTVGCLTCITRHSARREVLT
jgi:hypothetical protein